MSDDDISYEMDAAASRPKKKQKKVVDLLSSSDDDDDKGDGAYDEEEESNSSSEESSEFKELWEEEEEIETEIATHIEEQSQQQANNLLCTQPAAPPAPVAATKPPVSKVQRTPGVPKVVVPIKGTTPESLAMSSATQSYRTTTNNTDPTWTMQQVSKSKSTSPHVDSMPDSKSSAKKKKATTESEVAMPKPAKVSLSPRKAKSNQKAPAKSSKVISSLEAVGDATTTTTSKKASSKAKTKSSAKEKDVLSGKDSKVAAKKSPPNEKKKEATTSESKKRSSTTKDASKKAKVAGSSCVAEKSKFDETDGQAASAAKKPKSDESAKASKQPAAAASHAPRRKKRTFQDQVLLHMLLECKPYSLKTLAKSLNTTETALKFVMLSLVDKGVVIKKEFQGKKSTKELYWANQKSNAKEIKALQLSTDDMKQATEELRELKRRDAELTKELAAVSQELSNEELDAKLKESEEAVDGLKRQVAETKDRIKSQNAAPIAAKKAGFGPPKSAALLARERCPRRMKIRINAMRGEWKKRKEQCMDFVDTLADGLEKKPKEVVKMLDLETDEMEGVTMPPRHEVDD